MVTNSGLLLGTITGFIGILLIILWRNFFNVVDNLDLSKEEDRYKLKKYEIESEIIFSGVIAIAIILQIMLKLFGY